MGDPWSRRGWRSLKLRDLGPGGCLEIASAKTYKKVWTFRLHGRSFCLLRATALVGAVPEPSVGTIAVTVSREDVAVAVEPREAAIRVA